MARCFATRSAPSARTRLFCTLVLVAKLFRAFTAFFLTEYSCSCLRTSPTPLPTFRPGRCFLKPVLRQGQWPFFKKRKQQYLLNLLKTGLRQRDLLSAHSFSIFNFDLLWWRALFWPVTMPVTLVSGFLVRLEEGNILRLDANI